MRMEGRQPMSNLPTGTLTVLHTDIEDSTTLTRQLREQYPAVLATHRTLLRAAFTAHEGVGGRYPGLVGHADRRYASHAFGMERTTYR
jgi:class 3 adenylate cyclase